MPLYFISWIKANYGPSTQQKLRYLNFVLTKWFPEKHDFSTTINAIRSLEVAKWPQLNPLRCLFQWKGWKSTRSPYFISFSEREPVLRGFLCGSLGSFWSQRWIGVKETCGRSFRSFWRNLTISEEILWGYSFKSASCDYIVLNPATRWRSSTPDPCKTMLV